MSIFRYEEREKKRKRHKSASTKSHKESDSDSDMETPPSSPRFVIKRLRDSVYNFTVSKYFL